MVKADQPQGGRAAEPSATRWTGQRRYGCSRAAGGRRWPQRPAPVVANADDPLSSMGGELGPAG